jgi:hypothetical protein
MKLKYKLLAGVLSISSTLVISAETKETKGDRSYPATVKALGGMVTPVPMKADLRTLPLAKSWKQGDGIKQIPKRFYPPKDELSGIVREYSKDHLADKQTNFETYNNRAFTDVIINQDGQGFAGFNPPDTDMDIGKNYAIQAINASTFVVYDKTNGNVAAGPIAIDTLGTGSCATGAGDPIVIYDEAAERWFIQEFSSGGNFMCIYISMTDDPVSGGWNFYGFADTSFPDYPHFGVWPDAYYGVANAGNAVYAFDRTNMIAGNPARAFQTFHLTALDGYGFQVPTPADWDHHATLPMPPNGAPGIIMRHVDEEAHSNIAPNRATEDYLELYEFVVDFDNDANSSVTLATTIDIADFNSWLLNYTTFASVPQPNSSDRLDPIREAILNKLKYRNFGTHESITGVLATNIEPATAGSDVTAGLRWFELRRDAIIRGPSPWYLYQEGTYADTAALSQNRFMGSLAMDISGNIALAYSMTDTDTSVNPDGVPASLKYTGRLVSDPTGVMTFPETDLVIGAGANGSGRWGDYAGMGVDPVDGCTFWFTGEYASGSEWNTRISSFKSDACGEPTFVLSSNDTSQNVCTLSGSANVNGTINVVSVSGFTNDATLAFNPALPTGISGTLTPTIVTPGSSSSLALTVDNTVADGAHVVTVEGMATASDNRTIDFNINVTSTLPPAVTLTSPADAATGVSGSSVAYSWDAVAGADSYLIEIATDSGFSNIVESSTVFNNSFVSTVALASSSDAYWRVTANNSCGSGTISAVFMFTTSTEICYTTVTAIPDNVPAGVDNVLSVVDTGTLDGLTVSLQADHTWVGDLIFTLEHGGTTVVLMDRPGRVDSGVGCSSNNVDAIFDDASGTPVEDECATDPAIAGTLSPQEPLAGFNGAELSGDWVLNASDNIGLDTGSVISFCLIPTLSVSDLIFENGFETP